MEKLLDRTMTDVLNVLKDHGVTLNTWMEDQLRLVINSGMISACLVGRTEALQEVIRRLKEFKAPA